MTYLPDVNLWLALAFESHVHHESAKRWFNTLTSTAGCAFCRMTQQGLLRLASNPKAFGDEALSLGDAWRLFDLLASDSCVGFAMEPSGVEARWRRYTERQQFSPKVWNDAYLAAFAHEGQLTLITFDRAFAQYEGLTYTVLA